ncbi:MAG TPA: glycosyltransferase [Dehalococcoidia bacterium]|nr:glycosyltransferase [Dehalococcoidia bacterium]
MLQKVSLGVRKCDRYRLIMSKDSIDQVEALARELRGLRLCYINSTPFGGGVAELLVSYIPLLRGLGLHADWQIIRGDRDFFTITKALHNALQGKPYPEIGSASTRSEYLRHNLANARELDINYDVFVVNDPQPLALRRYAPENKAKWIWRCHVDSSEPDEEVWQFLRPFVEEYDAAIFTLDKFVPSDLRLEHIGIIAPAIDPFSSKNLMLRRHTCRAWLENLGIDKSRHMVVQVSRFDPWKDPFGVMEAYRLAKRELPDLQLVFVGSFAHDDPEAWDIYASIHEEANKDEDMWVFSNLTGVGSMEVNVFQTAADVVVQKSLKEGFGLVVAEALWKGIPVVAGNAGGIPLQMGGRLRDYLVNSVEECAQKMVYLLQNRELAEELGQEGQEHIRQGFLMPRLIRDELTLVKQLLGC